MLTCSYLPKKLQAVVVLQLGAILFYSGIHFKPLKLWEKKYREDLNRHIPQKINEFASLALAGRYPSSFKFSGGGGGKNKHLM